jgi:hypothetical protein
MAEVQVTTDCKTQAPTCVGPPYPYSPHIRTRLLLTRDPDARVADGVNAVRLGDPEDVQCSHTVHHCKLVFRNLAVTVATDPCGTSNTCFINVVANAWHADANANGNHRVLIGENEPSGGVDGNKGSVGVVRIRPGTATGFEDTSVEPNPAGGSYPVTDNLDGDRYVVFRKSIGRPVLGEEFSYDFVMQTNPTAPFPIRVSTQVVVAGAPGDEVPIGDVYPDGGKVSRFNGENCVPGTVCTTRHVGVFRAQKTFGQDLWLIVLAKSAAPFDDAGNNRYVVNIPSGRLEVTRYLDAS